MSKDDLLPCPVCQSDDLCFGEQGRYQDGYDKCWVECDNCGIRGPKSEEWKDLEGGASREWNALPRQPQWTEYDGSEKTLPNSGRVLVQLSKPPHYKQPGRFYDFWFADNLGLKYWHDADEEIQIGDRWLPWPLPGGGE